jgi:MFS family permease
VNEALPPPSARGTEARVIGVSFLAQMIASGMTTYSFGYFLRPIADEFGASRTAVASGQAIFMLGSALLLPVVGRLLDLRPVRGSIASGALLMGAGIAALAQITALWQAALLAGLIALGASLCGSLAASALVVRAIPDRRERALGLASVGTSAGGFVFPLLVVPLIGAFGWRGALAALGSAAALLLGSAAWLGTPREADPPPRGEALRRTGGPSVRGALASRNFWAITLAMMLVYGTNTALIAHLPALAGDSGVSAAQAALLVPALALASLVGKLAYSAVGDRVDARLPIWLAAGALAPALALLLVFPRFEVMLGIAVANGLGTGSLLPAWSGLVARCFGSARFAAVLALSRMCAYPLIAAGGMLAAFSKDVTGSYATGFGGFLVGCLLVAFLPFLMRLPRQV